MPMNVVPESPNTRETTAHNKIRENSRGDFMRPSPEIAPTKLHRRRRAGGYNFRMSENQSHAVELKPEHLAWLREMSGKHNLPDESKALRCLINFAREKTDLEPDIFEEIRCVDC